MKTATLLTALALALPLSAIGSPNDTYDVIGQSQFKRYSPDFPISVEKRSDGYYFCPTAAKGDDGSCSIDIALTKNRVTNRWLTASEFVESAEDLPTVVRPIVNVRNNGTMLFRYKLQRSIQFYTLTLTPFEIREVSKSSK